ncbi:MAG TPA: cytochrome C [bacterium]
MHQTSRSLRTVLAALLSGLICATAGAAAEPATYRVLAVNDLGMHCYDSDFAVFSILPLFNTVRAQVLRVGPAPTLIGSGAATFRYKAQADARGSINTTSVGKTNFWTYLSPLYGVSRQPDVGILGERMPGRLNVARPFNEYDAASRTFVAHGIPITAIDDARRRNPYNLMRITAYSRATGLPLASLPTVLPASDEMACGNCHLTGRQAAVDPAVTWSTDLSPTRQYKKNILLLHDLRMGTGLYASQPVLCDRCHYSLALDLAGTGPTGDQVGKPYLSRAVHSFHGTRIPQDPSGTGTCFLCHPGRTTQCLRGAMSTAGIGCVGCHGTMTAVGLDTRSPWAQEPRCDSCHTGDALANFDGSIIRRTAYSDSPDVATPIVATNTRFAVPPASLYRMSQGHGGVACAGCHGSPHAEWPSREANDNRAALALQGHRGQIVECGTCHGTGLSLTLAGPHGMHNVNSQAWVNGHEAIAPANLDACRACHGASGEGTVISRAQAERTFVVEDVGTVRIYRGTKIGCGNCHANPLLGGGA